MMCTPKDDSLSPGSLIVADPNESNNKLNALVICIINYDRVRRLLIIQRNREWLTTHVPGGEGERVVGFGANQR